MSQKVTAGRDNLGELAPQFAALNDDVLFGEVWAREVELSPRDRSLGGIPVIERNFGGGRVVLQIINMSDTSNQHKSFFLVAAIYRFLARMLSLIFSIKRGKDRVRVLIYSNDGKVLLVKGRFSRQQWALLGGGIRRNESYEKAAAREILEEVGINIENLRYLGKVNSYESYKPFPVRVFAATAINQDIKCNFEIIEAKWLAEQYIPEEYDSITD